MSIGRMSAFVLALAAVGALALAGIALGLGGLDGDLPVQPDQVPKRTYAKGKLFVHTHTDYTGGHKTLGRSSTSTTT